MINKIEGIKPFNDLMLKSCYYNQLAAGYSAFGIDPKIIAGNYLQLYEFDEKTKKLDVRSTSVNGKIIFFIGGYYLLCFTSTFITQLMFLSKVTLTSLIALFLSNCKPVV